MRRSERIRLFRNLEAGLKAIIILNKISVTKISELPNFSFEKEILSIQETYNNAFNSFKDVVDDIVDDKEVMNDCLNSLLSIDRLLDNIIKWEDEISPIGLMIYKLIRPIFHELSLIQDVYGKSFKSIPIISLLERENNQESETLQDKKVKGKRQLRFEDYISPELNVEKVKEFVIHFYSLNQDFKDVIKCIIFGVRNKWWKMKPKGDGIKKPSYAAIKEMIERYGNRRFEVKKELYNKVYRRLANINDSLLKGYSEKAHDLRLSCK